MAILPENMEQETIFKMVVGETGWIVPWALHVSPDGEMWIRGDYSIVHQEHGTSCVQIKRASGKVLVNRKHLERSGHKFIKYPRPDRDWQWLPVEWL